MELLVLAAGGIGLAVGGAWVARHLRRGAAHDRWRAALSSAAERLPGARASAGTRYDGPELRAEVEGRTVSLRVTGSGDRAEARAAVALGPNETSGRVWIGWDVDEAAADVAHLPELRLEVGRVEGTIRARGDDLALAQRTLDDAYLDLLDVRREARAHGAVLSVRGGYLELRILGIEAASPDLLERLIRGAARVAAAWSSRAR